MSGSAESGIRVWIHTRTGPRIPDPGLGGAVVRGAQGLLACLGADPAPSPWGFVRRGRGPNRKEGRWWTGEVYSEGGVGPETRGRRGRTRTGQRRRRALAGGREAGSVEAGGDGWLVSAVVARRAGARGKCAGPSTLSQRRSAIRPARRRRRRLGRRARRSCAHATGRRCRIACHERSAASNDACRRRAVAALGRRCSVGRSLKSRSGCGLACQPGIGSNQGSGT